MKKSPQSPRSRGFALIVTLSLMILLTVIAVGLLTLSSISLRIAAEGNSLATARSNARLALMLAIGELQKSVGPDKVITATSEILSATPEKPNTAGVWESWNLDATSSSLDYQNEKINRFRRWLVSTPDPTEAGNLDFTNQAWSGRTLELVGDASWGGTAPPGSKIVAGRVPVSTGGTTRGGFAWHVSDEAVKARINLYRDPSRNTTVAEKRALLSGQRPDPSVMSDFNQVKLDFLPNDLTDAAYGKWNNTVQKVTDLDQVGLIDSPGNLPGKIKSFRNDVTPHSLGLLTNVRTGGLKQDLSSVFEKSSSATSIQLPPAFDNKRLYQTTLGMSGVSDPNWSVLASYYNSFKGIKDKDSNPTYDQPPAQGFQLSPIALPTRFFPGPVIEKVEALFSFVVRDSHSNWVNSLHNVDPKMSFMGHLVYAPLVTLHNPYNVSISFENLEVSIRNLPVAFNFFVNNQAQSSGLVPLTEMFVDSKNRREKRFVMKIANWKAPTGTQTSGPIVMKPGQTLVCGPYLHPNASFSNNQGTKFFDYQNNLAGYDGSSEIPVNAKPGFAGRCVGYDVDWLTPNHGGYSSGKQTDNNMGVLGLRATDSVRIEYAVEQPTQGLNTSFQVTAKITTGRSTYEYGGMDFQYRDKATLKKLFPTLFKYPQSGSISASTAYVPNSEPLSSHARAQTIGVFSAYARTTSGGVYDNGTRKAAAGGLSFLRDGQLAGMPFLFHNPARTVTSMDLKAQKQGAQSHELNYQQFLNLGQVEDYFNLDSTNRTSSLTGNTTQRGIKSGSFLELPTGPMQTIADFRRSNALSSSYLPSFVQPVSNSLVSPLMTTDKVTMTDSNVASYALLDHSVLANQALYDRFYFSTFATYGSSSPNEVFEDFMNGDSPLLCQAFEPHLPPGETVDSAKSGMFSGGRPTDIAYQNAARYQMVRGAFNVNSTSVQAWKAMLASMNKADVVTLWAKNSTLEIVKSTKTPILPMSMVNGGAVGQPGGADANKIDNARTNEWNGYRELADADLEELARRIVEQVRLRGPFLSMAEFVNRQVGSESDLTRMGALENAIRESKINDEAFREQVPIVAGDISDKSIYPYNTPAVSEGNPAAGAPGWISQGDLMRILEPAATVRSDTFVIRVCGEAQDAGGNVTARAYAEAIVQRVPEYVDPANGPSLNVYTDSGASGVNKLFGRRMSVVSFRWLSSNEI